MGRKIGILGGTFDPIHAGHLLMGQYAKEAFALDEIWVVPTGVSYLKKDKKVSSSQTRLEMCRLATASMPGFSCSEVEIHREGNTYTYETFLLLNEQYPEDEFYFIMGSDSLFYLENWVKPEILLAYCNMIAATRGDLSAHFEEQQSKAVWLMEHLSKKYSDEGHGRMDSRYGHIYPLLFPNFEISSTDVRNRVKEGKSIRLLVPEAVRIYIEEKGLYHEE